MKNKREQRRLVRARVRLMRVLSNKSQILIKH